MCPLPFHLPSRRPNPGPFKHPYVPATGTQTAKMYIIIIFAIFTLIVTVQGAWWAAAAQPVILGLGAVLGTLNLDISDVKPITEWDYYVPTWTNLN